MARLNREVFKAPVLPGAVARAEALLAARNLDDREADLRRIGLSGAPAAAPILLRLLARERKDDNRTYVIDALANLGAAEAVQPLAERYAREDEDNRLFILKAWDYIGGEEARGLIAQVGGKDKDAACRALAGRLRGVRVTTPRDRGGAHQKMEGRGSSGTEESSQTVPVAGGDRGDGR